MGVPVILGANGVEQIIQLELTSEEQQELAKSAEAVRELIATMATL
jgi:malate dehydrogenase